MYEPVNNPETGKPVTRLLAIQTYVFPYFFPQTVKITGVWGLRNGLGPTRRQSRRTSHVRRILTVT